jgi:hypothetical protein
LKAVFANRTILEIQAIDPVSTMRALDDMPEVEKTSVFGTAVHAVLRNRSTDASALLRERLASRQLPVLAIAPVEPSLEDVFLDVVTEGA